MPNDSENKSLVAFMDNPNDTRTDWNKASVITLLHPSTGESQHFILYDKDIYEMTSISRNYGSFFIGSRVISNGALYVMTRIDPLFFVLKELESTKEAHQWQPLDQLNVSPIIQSALVNQNQWKHVCAVKTLGDDLVLYKFNEKKTLAWLKKKQEAAYTVVCLQMLTSKRNQCQATEKLMSEGGGAFSNTFRLVQDDDNVSGINNNNNTTTTRNNDLTSMELAACKEASVQIVCEYLSPEWQTKLRENLNMVLIQKEEKESKNEGDSKKQSSWEANPGQNDADQLLQFTMGTGSTKEDALSNSKKEPAKTAGLKRLAKVNTKGMKSLSSFFGAKKKKTN